MSDFENDHSAVTEQNDHPAEEYFYGQQAPAYNNGSPETENTLAGIVGAFLFSIGGGLIAFVLSLVGFVAAISGLVTIVLAVFGYDLFSGAKKKGITSKKAIIIGIIITIVMLFLAECCSWAYELQKVLTEEGMTRITFFDCLRILPEVFKETEALSSFLLSLILSYVFAAIGCFSYVKQRIKR
ncbi:MAG: hypothetical protein J1E60_02275 [Christensenellaceae bacterium]|nr:hypothetical protein [Christensenellaceae bacterium]